nr:2496_t:CDS:2 [Entrophospora candida]
MFFVPLIIQAFGGWIYGLATMVYFHNLIVSVFLYKARQTNVSNIFKIVFNLGGLIIYISEIWFLIVPTDVSPEECKAVGYLLPFGHIIHKSALSGFLLWRLKQIENRTLDHWLGIALFFCRFCFHFAQLPIVKPEAVFSSDDNSYFCLSGSGDAKIPLIGAISFDLAIDLYVTIRLVQILNRANKNASQISSNITRKTKRSLFTAVIYWNFLRLFFALCYNVIIVYYTAFSIYKELNYEVTTFASAAQVLLVILLSYSITADAEIVRVIEGKKDVNGSSSNSAGTGKSFKNMPQTPKSTSSHYQTSSEPPKYSTGNYSFSKNEKPESNDIGDNKIAVVSMKRLSFFEWANVIVGNKLVKKDNDIADEESGIETVEENGIEIVEENPEVAGNHSRKDIV